MTTENNPQVPQTLLNIYQRINAVCKDIQTTLLESKGWFSTLSKRIYVTTKYWSFEGTCKRIED